MWGWRNKGGVAPSTGILTEQDASTEATESKKGFLTFVGDSVISLGDVVWTLGAVIAPGRFTAFRSETVWALRWSNCTRSG